MLSLGITSPKNADFVLKDLLRDDSAAMTKDAKELQDRLNIFVNSGEDIIVDLRCNNGKVPKYEEFWSVVVKHIEDMTAVNDRRHDSADGNGDVVVYIAMASSYAEIY